MQPIFTGRNISPERIQSRRNNYYKWYNDKEQVTHILMGFCVLKSLCGLVTISLGIIENDIDEHAVVFSRMPKEGQCVSEALQSWSLVDYRRVVASCIGIAAILGGAIGFGLGGRTKDNNVKHNPKLLFGFGVLLSLLIAIQLALVIMCFVFRIGIHNGLEDFLHQTIKESYEGATVTNDSVLVPSFEPISDAWDRIMVHFECCGASGYDDFRENATRWHDKIEINSRLVTARMPVTCCKMADRSLFPESANEVEFNNLTKCIENEHDEYYNEESCLPHIWNIVMHANIIQIVTVTMHMLIDVSSVVALSYLHMLVNKFIRRRERCLAAKRTPPGLKPVHYTDDSTSLKTLPLPVGVRCIDDYYPQLQQHHRIMDTDTSSQYSDLFSDDAQRPAYLWRTVPGVCKTSRTD
ncbi:hypothetical protein LSAT2_011472 [Lamellibrachia satsuma]|nr:hypothetical protein LSAT2_011472 [Lamellibrachia satsuma]